MDGICKATAAKEWKPADPATDQGQHTSGLKIATCGPFTLVEAGTSSLLGVMNPVLLGMPGQKRRGAGCDAQIWACASSWASGLWSEKTAQQQDTHRVS